MLPRILAVAAAVVLTLVSVMLRLVLLGAHSGAQRPGYALGFVAGGLVVPLVFVAVASIWRRNRTAFRLWLAADAGLLLNVVVALASVGGALTRRPAADAEPALATARFRQGAIESCIQKCPQVSAQFEFPAASCQIFCACLGDELLGLERANDNSAESMRAAAHKCRDRAH